MTQTLDPTLDVVFKLLFAHHDTRDVLAALLTAVLQPKTPIVQVTVKNPMVDKASITDKGIVLDLLVELADGRLVDVEMQSDSRPGAKRRTLLYWARAYAANTHQGQDYTTLKPVIAVWFLAYCAFGPIPYHSRWQLQERSTGTPFSDALQLHTVELPKLAALTPQEHKSEADLVRWGRFMTSHSDAERAALGVEEPMVSKADNEDGILQQLSADPHNRALAEERQRALECYRIEMGAAQEQGEVLGEDRGKEWGEARGRQKRRKSLQRQLELRFPGALTAAMQQAIDQATDEQLDQWSDRVVVAATTIAEVFEP